MHFEKSDNIFLALTPWDEDLDTTEFQSLVREEWEKNGQSIVKVDLSKLQKANSVGIFEWIKALKELDGKIVYKNIPVWLISQFNTNIEFIKYSSGIESFYAPFYSDKEEKVKDFVLTVGKDVPLLDSYEDFELSEEILLGGDLEPEFDYEEYFEFLTVNGEPLPKYYGLRSTIF